MSAGVERASASQHVSPSASPERRPGLVALVGAGPGRSDLITVRGLELLEHADVVVHDRLDTAELLDRAGVATPTCRARLVDVGKHAGSHPVPQSQINRILVAEASRASLVVRLKGGDPYVFGRGGEEASALAEAGVPFEVVPGVTSALAALSSAGIPATDRRYAASFHVLTGHRKADGELGIDFGALVRAGGTDVFLMAVATLGEVSQGLLDAGASPETPACVVERGTLPEQRRIDATLSTVADAARAAGVVSPAILVVGEVCRLAPELDWFDALPLRGRAVAVTRPRDRAPELADGLRRLGARVVEVPLIETVSLPAQELVPLMRHLGDYAWVALTSVEGVRCLRSALEVAQLDARALAGTKVAAVGPATAAELVRGGIRADLVPETYDTEHLAHGLVRLHAGSGKVLLFRARGGSRALSEALGHAGIPYDDVAAYETREVTDGVVRNLASDVVAGGVDAVTLTSPSCARALRARLLEVGCAGWPDGCVAVCLGPSTRREAEGLGMRCVEASSATVPALVEATRLALVGPGGCGV